jgi:hypothetical protein
VLPLLSLPLLSLPLAVLLCLPLGLAVLLSPSTALAGEVYPGPNIHQVVKLPWTIENKNWTYQTDSTIYVRVDDAQLREARTWADRITVVLQAKALWPKFFDGTPNFVPNCAINRRHKMAWLGAITVAPNKLTGNLLKLTNAVNALYVHVIASKGACYGHCKAGSNGNCIEGAGGGNAPYIKECRIAILDVQKVGGASKWAGQDLSSAIAVEWEGPALKRCVPPGPAGAPECAGNDYYPCACTKQGAGSHCKGNITD